MLLLICYITIPIFALCIVDELLTDAVKFVAFFPRFGRFTVATLESKLESSEKQITKLEKALERSDEYIEDLEKQLQNGCQSIRKSGSSKVKGRLFTDSDLDFSRTDSNLNDSELPSRISNISEPISELVSDVRFDDSDLSMKLAGRKTNQGQSSFDLDIPSPLSKSSKPYTDTDATEDSCGLGTDDTFVLPKPSMSKTSGATLDSCKKKLRFAFADDQNFRGSHSKDIAQQHDNVKAKVRFSVDVEHSALNSSDPNVSMTPDLEDCFRIMDEAKRKLEERQHPISLSGGGVTSAYTSLAGSLMSAPLAAEQQNRLYPQNMQATAAAGMNNTPSTGDHYKLATSESAMSKLSVPGKPLMGQCHVPGVTKSDIFAVNSQLQNGLFSIPSASQSVSMLHMTRPQVSLSGNGLLTKNINVLQQDGIGGFSAGSSVFTGALPSTMPRLHTHTLEGSTFSQPTQSMQYGADVVSSAAFLSNKRTITGFSDFTTSQ